jgi:hypothetical protein
MQSGRRREVPVVLRWSSMQWWRGGGAAVDLMMDA